MDYLRLSIIHNLPPFHLFHFENAHDDDHVQRMHEDMRYMSYIHEQIPKEKGNISFFDILSGKSCCNLTNCSLIQLPLLFEMNLRL